MLISREHLFSQKRGNCVLGAPRGDESPAPGSRQEVLSRCCPCLDSITDHGFPVGTSELHTGKDSHIPLSQAGGVLSEPPLTFSACSSFPVPSLPVSQDCRAGAPRGWSILGRRWRQARDWLASQISFPPFSSLICDLRIRDSPGHMQELPSEHTQDPAFAEGLPIDSSPQ